MKHNASSRRSRNNRSNSGRRTPNKTQVFDSNGPDVRIRGTAHQVCEKYLALAKDASSAGDRILAESYLQHAEHYQRVINSWEDGLQNRVAEQSDNMVSKRPAKPAEPGNEKDDDLGLPMSLMAPVSAKEEMLEDA